MKVSKPQPQRKLLVGDVNPNPISRPHPLKVVTSRGGMQNGANPFSLSKAWVARQWTPYPVKKSTKKK